MATSSGGGNWQTGVDDGDETERRRLVGRQDTSRRLPQSEDLNETTVTALDGRSATESRPHAGVLPAVAKPTSSDDPWSSVPPARTDDNRSSVKSNSGQSPAVPARLPALDVRHWSKDDVRTDAEDGQQTARPDVESIGVEDGSGKLEEEEEDAKIRSREETKDENRKMADNETEPQESRDSTSQSRDDETRRSSGATESGDKGRDVSPHRGNLTSPEKMETFEKSPADTRSRNGANAQREDAREVEQPGENDSGVNVEDVHDDEPTQSNDDAVQRRRAAEIPAVDVTSAADDGDESSRRTTPQPSDDEGSTSSPSRHHLRRQNGDVDRLSVGRSPRFDPERRRNSRMEMPRDSGQQQQQQSDEGLDQNKYRLLILAQKGEWSVFDQTLRAMERSSYYEINLADEVSFSHSI